MFGRHAGADFLLRQVHGKPGGGALHFETRLFAGRFDFVLGLSVNACDFGLRSRRMRSAFAFALFLAPVRMRCDFLFQIASFACTSAARASASALAFSPAARPW